MQQGIALLQAPTCRQHRRYQGAQCQLVTGLVHAVHGAPPGDAALRSAAEVAVQQAIFSPLAAALQELAGLGGAVAGLAPAAPMPLAVAAQQRATLWRLHASLRQLQALLNGLESYALYEGPSDSYANAGSSGSLAGQEAACGVAAAAVRVVLACWPQLAEVCAWRCGGAPLAPAGDGAALRRDLCAEVAQCLSSCIGWAGRRVGAGRGGHRAGVLFGAQWLALRNRHPRYMDDCGAAACCALLPCPGIFQHLCRPSAPPSLQGGLRGLPSRVAPLCRHRGHLLLPARWAVAPSHGWTSQEQRLVLGTSLPLLCVSAQLPTPCGAAISSSRQQVPLCCTGH